MTYADTQEILCEKLRSIYSPRIAKKVYESRNADRNTNGGKASSDRASYGKNRERENTSNQKSTFGASAQGAEKQNTKRVFRNINGGKDITADDFGPFLSTAEKYSSLRKYSMGFKEDAYLENNPEQLRQKKVKERKTVRRHIDEAFSRDEEEKTARRDIRSMFSFRTVFCIVFVLAAMMLVLQANASYSRTLSEVKNLRDEQMELTAERDRLVNLIGVKDDIREIEAYALNEIGMVKSDYVQSAIVSVAGGEHIDVIDVSEEENANFFSTLLSAMNGRFETLKDYID